MMKIKTLNLIVSSIF